MSCPLLHPTLRNRGNVEKLKPSPLRQSAAHLLVVTAVQVAHLTDQLWVDEPIGGDEVVRQRRLAVVHVREDADVAYAVLRGGIAPRAGFSNAGDDT